MILKKSSAWTIERGFGLNLFPLLWRGSQSTTTRKRSENWPISLPPSSRLQILTTQFISIVCRIHCPGTQIIVLDESSESSWSTGIVKSSERWWRWGILQSEDDPWIKHLNYLWNTCFEQHEPPTDDKLLQVNLGTEEHLKLIFVGKSLSPSKRNDLFQLIRKYIDVFAWNYEDIPGLDSQVAMHWMNIEPKVKPIKKPQRHFLPEIMGAIVRSQEAHRF